MPPRSIDADKVTDLIYGDRPPARGVAMLGRHVYDGGRLIGIATLVQRRIEAGPTKPLDYERIFYGPLEAGE
jgi:hypothetical protein